MAAPIVFMNGMIGSPRFVTTIGPKHSVIKGGSHYVICTQFYNLFFAAFIKQITMVVKRIMQLLSESAFPP